MPILGSNIGKLGSLGTSTVTRYVAPDGNDNAAGTFTAPYATIAKALTAAPTNATVYVYEGTYLEPLTITKPVKIRSCGSGDPVIRPNADGRASAVLISANNVTLDGLVIDAVNRWRGIDINAACVTIRGCVVCNCVGDVDGRYGQGIIVTSNASNHNIAVCDTVIYNVGGTAASLGYCHAVYTSCVAMIVRGCEMYDIEGYAVHWYGSAGGDLIANDNYMHDLYGGVGVFNSTALVYNNVIRDTTIGLAARYNVVDAQFYFNTLTDGGGMSVAALADGGSVLFQNNVYLNVNFAAHWEQLTPSTAVVIANHNLRDGNTQPDYQGGYASAWSNSYVSGSFSPITDDSGAGIKPTTGNPAINAGVTVTSVTTDRGGNVRSATPTLGAWEAA